MSTKIYNGIKFKSNNIVEIIEQLQNVRTEVLKICNTSEIVKDEDLSNFITYYGLDKNIKPYSSIEINRKMINSLETEDEIAYLFLHFNFSIYVIPYKDGNIYGGLFCDNVNYKKYIDPYIEDFHYQGQTDRPEEITEEEWENRRNIWDEIFDKFWTFSEVGLKYEIAGPKNFRMYERIEEVLKKLEDAKENITNDKNETL